MNLSERFQLWIPFLLAATMLAVPISPTAKSILITLTSVMIVCIPAYRKAMLAMLSQRWCQALFGLFFLILLACLWSPATTSEKMSVFGKYVKLIYLPILAVGFRDPRARRFGMYAFIAAMVITCLLSMLKNAGLLAFNGPDPGQIFNNHIMTSFMMVFATYLCAWLYMNEHGKSRVLWAVLIILFSYQILFINTGRIGYIFYLLLMTLFFLQTLSWRKALVAVLLGCSLFTVSYFQSAPMQFVVKQGIDNLREYQEGHKDSSIGYRIQFHLFAKNLMLKHPLIGNGTGSYTHFFREEKPVPDWYEINISKKLFEPHSQYWLVAAELGLFGIFALFFFFGSLFVAGLRLHSMRAVAVALILSFMVGSLSDSLLFYSGTGLFFLLFMAMCLGEQSVGPTK